jgi:lipopolysaccharide exporter
MVAPEAVRVLLGAKWTAATPMLAVLALWGTLRSLSSSGGYLLMSVGLPKFVAATTFISVVVFAGGAAVALWTGHGAFGIAIAKVVAGCVSLVTTVTFVVTNSETRMRMVVRSVIRPLLAATAMAAVLQLIPATPYGTPVDLAMKIVVGAAVYVPFVVLLWAWVGRPDGPEQLALNVLKRIVARKRGD